MREHRAKLVTFLNSVAKPGCSVGVTDDDNKNLVQSGVIDSFAIIQIIFYLEQDYGIDLSAMGVDHAELVSIDGMLSAIERSFD
jgi:acyl carrier protein